MLEMQATVQCRAAKCRTVKGGTFPASFRRCWKKKGITMKTNVWENLFGNFGELTRKGDGSLISNFG